MHPATPIAEVVSLLLRRGYRSLPVVADDGKLVGIITDGDLLRRTGLQARLDLQDELSTTHLRRPMDFLGHRNEQAVDIMTHRVITVQRTDSLRQAVARMAEHDLKRLPVVDGERRLVALLGRASVLRGLLNGRPGT